MTIRLGQPADVVRADPAGRVERRSSVALVMIVRDEAANLGACVEPIRDLFDEVVLVDTGSTDETRSIARGFGAVVIDFPWRDDFAAARNEALRHARAEWILSLDADDRILPPNVERLARLLGRLDERNVGYVMSLSSVARDGGALSAAAQVRLFRRRPDVRWEGRIHEEVGTSIVAAGGAFEATDVEIVHVGYAGAGDVRAKLERNLRLADAALAAAPLDSVALFHRGRTLLALGRPAEALVALELCVAGAGRLDAPALIEAKSRALVGIGDLLAARTFLDRAVAFHPEDPNLRLLDAQVLAALGVFGEAEERLRASPEGGEDRPIFWTGSEALREVGRRQLLAEIAWVRQEARAALERAVSVVTLRPAFGPAWIIAGEASLTLGDLASFERIVARLEVGAPGSPGATVLVAARARVEGRAEEAEGLLDAGLARHPDDAYLLRARAELLAATQRPAAEQEAALDRAMALLPLCPRCHGLRRALAPSDEGAPWSLPPPDRAAVGPYRGAWSST